MGRRSIETDDRLMGAVRSYTLMGDTAKWIGRKLEMSPRTVDRYRQRLRTAGLLPPVVRPLRQNVDVFAGE